MKHGAASNWDKSLSAVVEYSVGAKHDQHVFTIDIPDGISWIWSTLHIRCDYDAYKIMSFNAIL